jgi:hypothetical protein
MSLSIYEHWMHDGGPYLLSFTRLPSAETVLFKTLLLFAGLVITAGAGGHVAKYKNNY